MDFHKRVNMHPKATPWAERWIPYQMEKKQPIQAVNLAFDTAWVTWPKKKKNRGNSSDFFTEQSNFFTPKSQVNFLWRLFGYFIYLVYIIAGF